MPSKPLLHSAKNTTSLKAAFSFEFVVHEYCHQCSERVIVIESYTKEKIITTQYLAKPSSHLFLKDTCLYSIP